MVKKRYARDPLFYIQQPKITKPEAPMQHNYSTPRNASKGKPQQNSDQTGRTQSLKGDNFQHFRNPQPDDEDGDVTEFQQEEDDTEEQDGAEDPKEEVENKNRPKFKDMSIEEKINYFVNTPPHIPKLKCEVRTEEKAHRGIMVDQEDETILMRTGRRKISVPKNEIIEIRMLGM
ncbi:CotO family spore coat protein [Lentibacillus sp. Marseille-P4043]|uniref:CotO family spore coat protein n=1 Tax=Lentibacillus sp. Marseille-P4043 TaxID=2040293 RepID=UPI000D0B706C|nr:CotO family spore coat protein [Lentibacillus sp. Marseille-P4043]